MDKGDAATSRWLRRPRRPAPAPLSSALFWLFAAFLLGVAFLVGIGVVLTEEQWWAVACGGAVSLAALTVSVWSAAYFLRPVDAGPREPGAEDGPMLGYRASLERDGCAEILLSRGMVARTVGQALGMVLMGAASVFVVGGVIGVAGGVLVWALALFLGVLPHLEFATGGRPAVRVDATGISIARWTPLTIPWTQVVSVRVHQGSPSQSNVVVHVRDDFFDSHLAARPRALRAIDRVFTVFTGRGFVIPSTVAATSEPLAAWLDSEARRRRQEGSLTDR